MEPLKDRLPRAVFAIAAMLTIACPIIGRVPDAVAQESCPEAIRLHVNKEWTDLDLGWTGAMHDGQLVEVDLDLAVTGCAGSPPDCGVCTLAGPIANPDPAISPQRCSNDISIPCTSDTPCQPGGGTCTFFFGAPLPLAGGGVPVCIVNEITESVTGTVDTEGCGISSGALALQLRARMFAGEALAAPCPQCVDGACTGGPRLGMPCTAHGTSELFGDTSFDCPPNPGAAIGAPPIDLHLETGLQTRTLTATSPTCRAVGFTTSKCFCDTCDDADATPCGSNADCVAVGATVCGGKRCVGGGNAGAACALGSSCPGGACGVPGTGTAPNACSDGLCTPNTPPDQDSVNEGVCAAGPIDSTCAQQRFQSCVTDADCNAVPEDYCRAGLRECFTDNGAIGGAVSVSGRQAGFGALFCTAPSTSSSLNAVAGVPGLGRLTLPARMTLADCCDEEGSESDEDADEDVETENGDVPDLYSAFQTDTDTWYPSNPCEASLGGELDEEDINPSEGDDLSELGIDPADMTSEEAEALLAQWEDAIADQADTEPPLLLTAPPVTEPYTPPAVPHVPDPGCYVFGGRDIVFVHGLRTTPIKAALGLPGNHEDHDKALTGWEPPTSFPGSGTNPSFYGDGYWKTGAEQYWERHIKRFLKDRNIKNRYLIVAWASTQRLEVSAQAILTQIGDAMVYGTGVVNDANPAAVSGFGTPSFVLISHSTGGPVTDVAMEAAANNANLEAQFIPQLAKAHLGIAGAFSGSHIATAAVALSGFAAGVGLACTIGPLSPPCALACGVAGILLQTPPCVGLSFATFASSVLVDLVPPVMQRKWGDEIDGTPVRTATIVGGHGSAGGFLVKSLLLGGFDDGVLGMNSQVANPNRAALWPSGYIFKGERRRVKDMGLKTSGSPKRARGYFRDQGLDARGNGLSYFAAAATPYLSTSGMVQPSHVDFASNSLLSPLARYDNHFSFLQAAADHFGTTPGSARACDGGDADDGICSDGSDCPGGGTCLLTTPVEGFNGNHYKDTGDGEYNFEESRVVSDKRIYDEYVTPCDPSYGPCFGDNQPLIRVSDVPRMIEVTRGRQKKHKKKEWKWKRNYHVLKGWRTKVAADYMYGSVLASPLAGDCLDPPRGPNNCAAKKKLCAAQKACARLKCSETALKNGTAVDATCLLAASVKFQACFERLDSKQSLLKPISLCPGGVGDATLVGTTVSQFVEDVVAQLGGTDPVLNPCAGRKLRCVCNKLRDLLKCHAKAERKAFLLDPFCLEKAKAKFDGGSDPAGGCFGGLEAAYPPGACLTVGDTAAVETAVDEWVDDVVCQIDPGGGTCP